MIGAACGGLVTYWFGTTVDYIVDSVSYMISAVSKRDLRSSIHFVLESTVVDSKTN